MCISTMKWAFVHEEQLINLIDYLKLLTCSLWIVYNHSYNVVLLIKCAMIFVTVTWHDFMEMFKITEQESRKQTAPLTSDQLFVGLWRCHFLMPQDSNPPSVSLTTPHFNFNRPRGAQVGTSTFGRKHNNCISLKPPKTLCASVR